MNRVRRELDPATARALTSAAYASKGHYAETWHRELGLFDFEERAVADHFPPPPARILVPGCGAGRELVALRALGYEVAGTDPDAAMVLSAQQHLGAEVPIAVGWLQDLVSDPDLMPGPWDAILVGWGALGHLLETAERREVLAALRARCDGPVLVSWRVAPRQGLRGYAHTTGAVRAQSGARPEEQPTQVAWHDTLVVGLDGLVDVRLDRAQITADAHAAGFQTVHYLEPGEVGFPCAVLAP